MIVFSLILPSSNVSANTTDYSPIISFDKTQGMIIDSTTSIDGYIEDEEKPTSVWWTLFSESSIIYSDIITEKITIINSSDNRSKWYFNILFESEIISCKCYLEIYVRQSSKFLANRTEHGTDTSLPPRWAKSDTKRGNNQNNTIAHRFQWPFRWLCHSVFLGQGFSGV